MSPLIRSALFGLFTSMMYATHVYLIITGKSTVESFSGQDQSQHESRYLQTQLGFWTGSRDAKKAKRKWKEEWGGSNVDERWRVGGALNLWKREMGVKWYEWICKLKTGCTDDSSRWSSFGRRDALSCQSEVWAKWRVAKEAGLASGSSLVVLLVACTRLCGKMSPESCFKPFRPGGRIKVQNPGLARKWRWFT